MFSSLNPSDVSGAFSDRPDLKRKIEVALQETPQHYTLFQDIASYVQDLRTAHSVPSNTEPQSKKRKLEGGAAGGSNGQAGNAWIDGRELLVAKDVSFSVPQRKKFTLRLSGLGGEGGGIEVVNTAAGSTEARVAWGSIEQVLCLPVPEKAQRQYSFVVFPRGGDGVTPPAAGGSTPETLVFTVQEKAPVGITLASGAEGFRTEEDTEVSLLKKAFNQQLKAYGKAVVVPTEKEFASATPESHRKTELAYHVKAHRGSKDGYLFFLSTGIAWVFKKPLVFFSFDTIQSVSYTSVLARTFNLNIASLPPDAEPQPDAPQEIEFSMLDQADFGGIDEYVKRHGLQDASMAAKRKAVRLNVNGVKSERADGKAVEEDGEGELAKAEQELQDLEDEEEEDYDPGSEGESDGSGSSDEEEGGEAYDEGYEGGDGDEDQEDEEDVMDELGEEQAEVMPERLRVMS